MCIYGGDGVGKFGFFGESRKVEEWWNGLVLDYLVIKEENKFKKNMILIGGFVVFFEDICKERRIFVNRIIVVFDCFFLCLDFL